jgi:hypothetical protein
VPLAGSTGSTAAAAAISPDLMVGKDTRTVRIVICPAGARVTCAGEERAGIAPEPTSLASSELASLEGEAVEIRQRAAEGV